MNSYPRSAIVRKMLLMMLLVPAVSLLFPTCYTVSANTDTTWSVSFRLNMTKAINDHIFHPDSDYVYLIMDQGIQPFKLVPGPGYTYTGTLFNELDSGVTYHYKFRINENQWETVTRTVTAKPGMVNVSAWWNDEALNYTSFTVNMKYAVQYGMFNPAIDTVCIVGTMNSMQGSPRMQRIDTTLSYSYIYPLDPGTIQQYKYRINADSSGLELLWKPNRIIRVPDTLLEVTNDFNNFNPAKRLMTFNCDMGYFVKAHHFYPSTDFLDVAGNFDNWGANDVLFDLDGDTIYSAEMYFDTTWFHQGPLEFNFRINGNWKTSETCCIPYRSCLFHDTINQNPNIFNCFYRNLDPSVPTRPWVYNVAIQGRLVHKQVLSGVYAYENVNGIPEDGTTYQWYQSPDATGNTLITIDSAWRITYTVDTLDIGKWLVFEVTPKAVSGDSATGKPVRVVSETSISAWDVGIGEYNMLISKVYPNPAIDFITIEARKEIERIEVVSQIGQTVMAANGFHSKAIRLNIKQLSCGYYFLRAFTSTNETGTVKLIKQ